MSRTFSMRRLAPLILGFAAFGAACASGGPSVQDDGIEREVAAEPEATPPAALREPGVTIRLAVSSDWSGDPGEAGPTTIANRVLAGLLHEGLTAIDSDGEVVPGLAERWFVSDDRLTWTFVLPEGLTDNLGEPLTAADVKRSLESLGRRGPADPAVVALRRVTGWNEFVAGDSGGAAGLSAVNETTLVVQLSAPYEELVGLLAEPAYGVTGVGADGQIRTTGDFRYESDDVLVAVDVASGVGRIELVRTERAGVELLADGTVDWAVLSEDDDVSSAPGDVIRQPLSARVGMVVRLADEGQRGAVMGALNSVELAFELNNATAVVSQPIEVESAALPSELTVHVPEGPLVSMVDELVAQLSAAGAQVDSVVVNGADFAEAVLDGTALIFPMVVEGVGPARAASVEALLPDGPDDVFGFEDDTRAGLVEQALANSDPDRRAELLRVAEDRLREDYLWLPVADLEARVGMSTTMSDLRVLPDGTFDLSGF